MEVLLLVGYESGLPMELYILERELGGRGICGMGGVKDGTLRRDFLGVLSCFKMCYIIGSMCGDDVTAYHKGMVFETYPGGELTDCMGIYGSGSPSSNYPDLLKEKDPSQEIHVVFNLVRERWKPPLHLTLRSHHILLLLRQPPQRLIAQPQSVLFPHQSTYHPVEGLTYLHDLRRC